MIFIGIDASLTCTGLAVYEDSKNIFTYDRVQTKPKDFKNDIERLEFITKSIIDFVSKQSTPSLICLEDVYVSKFQTGSSMKLMGLAYILRTKLYYKNLPFYIVSPSQLKKHILQKGNAQKNLIMMEVLSKYGIKVPDDNIADALVLSKIAHEVYCYREAIPIEMNRTQSQVIKTISEERPCYNTKWKNNSDIEE